ncbi:helix-turn-helix domain-containing protein [Cohnella zeiphila]|uniref:AraC family transcriptional regulator n=1 Tax=Cohnella zeiphila TaxID=2761120 RepID=A0A7X0SNP0_9BACL|nr:helix-turn-helix domain-containing protein [Cohnella zeiphila]MBB6733261.1 AraC family transcriptional regulator [Cohnella zeiphila]
MKLECRIDADAEHELHRHDLLEISVLLENEAKFKLLDREYRGAAGDVFLFRPYEPHYNLAADPRRPIRWILVLFSASVVRLIPGGYRLLYPFYSQEVCPHLPAASPYAARIREAAMAAYEEQEEQLPGWESKQFMHFTDILVNLYRYSLEQAESAGESEPAVDAGVVAAVEHILKHLTEDIDVRELIALYGKGKTCFYSRFRQAVGVTPNRFIHRLRMQVAMHLLKTTELSITDIAFECGYSSIPYFNKHFKQYRDISPREYRNRVRRAM